MPNFVGKNENGKKKTSYAVISGSSTSLELNQADGIIVIVSIGIGTMMARGCAICRGGGSGTGTKVQADASSTEAPARDLPISRQNFLHAIGLGS